MCMKIEHRQKIRPHKIDPSTGETTQVKVSPPLAAFDPGFTFHNHRAIRVGGTWFVPAGALMSQSLEYDWKDYLK